MIIQCPKSNLSFPQAHCTKSVLSYVKTLYAVLKSTFYRADQEHLYFRKPLGSVKSKTSPIQVLITPISLGDNEEDATSTDQDLGHSAEMKMSSTAFIRAQIVSF